MPGDLALPVSVPFYRICHLPVPLLLIDEYTLFEYFIKCRLGSVPLASGDLGNVPVLPEVVNVAVHEVVISQEYLALDLRPDGLLPDPPFDELAVLFFRLGRVLLNRPSIQSIVRQGWAPARPAVAR